MTLAEQRQIKAERVQELNKAIESETITAEQRSDLSTLLDEVDTLDKQIEDEQRAKNVALNKIKETPKKRDTEENLVNNFSLFKVLRSQIDGKPLDGAEAEIDQVGREEAKDLGVQIQGFAIPSLLSQRMNGYHNRSLDAATAATAKNLIATNLGSMIPALYPKLKLDQLGVTRMNGLVGDLELPAGDAIATASYKTETGASDETTPTTRKIKLSPKRIGAWTKFSLQLLNQSSIDLQMWVIMELMKAEARKTETVAYYGGASNEPTGLGLYATPAANLISLGTDGGSITRAKLIECERTIEDVDADFDNARWVFTPTVKAILRELEEASGSGQGFVWKNDDKVLGYDALISNLLPKTLTKGSHVATDLHMAAFGDWSKLIIGYWGLRDLVVDNITAKKTGQVEVIMNAFNDVQITQPKAFSIIKDIIVA